MANPVETTETTESTPPVPTDDAAVSVSTGARLLNRFSRKQITLAAAIVLAATVVAAGMVVSFLGKTPELTAPEMEVSVENEFASQIVEILAGRANRLYFTSLPINDDVLNKLPFDELRAASQLAAEQAAIEEQKRQEKKRLEVSSDEEENQPGHSVAVKPQKTKPSEARTETRPDPIARLDTVLIDQGVVTDKGLATLARLPDLEHLRLRLSPITDEGIESLRGCQKLWLLNLPHSRLTNEGVRELRNLPGLKQLRLGSPELNNECCRALAEITSLRGLHLIGIPVTDHGLKVLSTLPQLESLYLDDSAVTDTGWAWLFQNHPQLHVHVNQQHHDRDPHAHRH